MTATTADIIGNALADAAERGIIAGRDGTAVDTTATGIALTVLTEHKLAERTIVYPTVMHARQAEAAVEVVAAERAEYARVRQILKLDQPRSGYIVNSIDLGGGTWIVEVEKGPFGDRAAFTVVFDSKDTRTFHASLDEALLYAVELRAGGDPDRGGYRFAARALGVKTTD